MFRWLALIFILTPCLLFGQLAQKEYNFDVINKSELHLSGLLYKNTPKASYKHPEFGTIPYRTSCNNCIELVQKRTYNSRYYIDDTDPSYFYVMKSYGDLHFTNDAGQLISFDPRLSYTSETGVYQSKHLPVKKVYNKTDQFSKFVFKDAEFTFNKNLSLYFIDATGNKVRFSKPDYTNTTVGEDGVLVTDIWPNIDLQIIYKIHQIKTNLVIKAPLNLPDNKSKLVLEDSVYLPKNSTIGFEETNNKLVSHYGINIYNQYKQAPIQYKTPICYDAAGIGMPATYDLITKSNNTAIIKTIVPTELLTYKGLVYPLTIDPPVEDSAGIGFFGYVGPVGLPVRSNLTMAFTSDGTGNFPMVGTGCMYSIIVEVPGKSTLLEPTIVDIEYENPNDLCRPFYAPDSICEFEDLRQFISTACNIAGPLGCRKAPNPPWIGTCTTDPNKVPVAQGVPLFGLIDCFPPQCPNHILEFFIENQSRQCQETCGEKCAIQRFWAITQGGRTLEGYTEIVNIVARLTDTSVCATAPVRLTAYPSYGVPPYSYFWVPLNSTDSTILVNPVQTTDYTCTIYDQCDSVISVEATVFVLPTPPAVSGDSTSICKNTSLNLGGTPTSSFMASIQWTAIPPQNIGLLSSSTIQNPDFTPPLNTVGVYVFVVAATENNCSRYDTIQVTVIEPPVPQIIPTNSQFCEGDSVQLSVVGSYDDITWSDGSTDSTLLVTETGSFAVTVVEGDCEGVSNTATVNTVTGFNFNALPDDTSVDQGSTVVLYTDISLNDPSVAEYEWFPDNLLDCNDCNAPLTSPEANQIYTLVVVTQDGCVTVDSASIRVILPDQYAIYSAFSPNGDGINDKFWIIKASGVTVESFQVFTRWGDMVHNSPEPWDGTKKGKKLPVETYSFLFKLLLPEGETRVEAGTIVLVR